MWAPIGSTTQIQSVNGSTNMHAFSDDVIVFRWTDDWLFATTLTLGTQQYRNLCLSSIIMWSSWSLGISNKSLIIDSDWALKQTFCNVSMTFARNEIENFLTLTFVFYPLNYRFCTTSSLSNQIYLHSVFPVLIPFQNPSG